MTYIISTLIIILGLIVFSFTIGNIILIIFFAIPLTKKLEKVNILKKNNIIPSYIVALIIQIIIFTVTTSVFYIYLFDTYFIGLMIGYGIALLTIITKIKQFGLNLNNFSDYFEKNKIFFFEEFINIYESNNEKAMKFIKVSIQKK